MGDHPNGAPLWIDLVDAALAAGRDRVAVVRADDPEATGWTGRELARRVGGAIGVLDAAGAPPGDAVPALVTTGPEALALVVAGAASGRPIAPLSPRLTVAELAGILEGLPGPVLLSEPESVDVGTKLAAATGRRLVVVDELGPTPEPPVLAARPDDVAFVLHTSGTTGRPRRVDVRQDRMGARALVHSRSMQFDARSVFSCSSPFHHIGGLGNLAVAMAVGSRIVAFPRFSIEAWKGLERLGVTHVQTIPTMIEMLLRADAFALPTLRLLQYGSSPIHPDTLRRAIAAMPGISFVNLFGQTEGSPLTCLTPEDHRRAVDGAEHLLQSVGRPLPEVELRIAEADETGAGEVLARASHLLLTDEQGWQHTGDLGRLADDGYLFLLGRKGDMIIRGGENVYPLEVEQTLARHADVVEAAVVGIPDPRVGEAVKAFVVPRDPDAPPSTGDLRTFARATLSGFKVPEHWEFVAELPRNPNGKVVRRLLQA